jgi:hypothetical protein
MIEAFARFDARMLPPLPEKIRNSSFPGVADYAELEITIPYLR